MAIYTVHEPPLKRYEATVNPERFQFVRDGFSFWAFVLAPLWMLRHRMWLVLLGYLVLMVLVEVAMQLVGASVTARTIVGLLVSLLVGIEAGTLRRFTLGRRRFDPVGLVAGDDLEAAERRFFDSWVHRDATVPSTPQASPLSPPGRAESPVPDIIGLFPQPGVQR
jgi:hypothetical protein